jgi:hypothetical protein
MLIMDSFLAAIDRKIRSLKDLAAAYRKARDEGALEPEVPRPPRKKKRRSRK